MNYFRECRLSPAAANLIQFDEDSIRRLGNPDVWLADPAEYERNGRVLRDSESPRMLAYSTKDHVLYGTDGCNTCFRQVGTTLESLATEELKSFARDNELRLDLLEGLKVLVGK